MLRHAIVMQFMHKAGSGVQVRTERELLIVRVLDQQRNFGRAASILSMTQPALSRALQRIEQDLGVLLFDRSKTHVAPTAEGKTALRHADALIKGFADLRRETTAPRLGETSDFRVSIGPLVAEAVGMRAFTKYASMYPRSHGQVLIRDWKTCIADVREGRSDLAVTDLPSVKTMPDLDGSPLGREPGQFFCASGHPLARANLVGWAELVSFPWAFTAVQARFADMIPVSLDKAGRVDRETGLFYPAIRVETFDGMKATVRNGHAISICSPHFLMEEFASGEMALIDFFEPWMQISYGLIWRRNSLPSGALKAFVDVLVDTQRERDAAFLT
jgi:DNA-binding transcriptional LysR family regulator